MSSKRRRFSGEVKAKVIASPRNQKQALENKYVFTGFFMP